jgi:plastocyanin
MLVRVTSVLILAMSFAACGGYSSPSTPSAAPTPAPVGSTTVNVPGGASTLTTTAFGQNPLTISVGTTVSWLNTDNTTHTTAADGSQWSSGNIAPGGRFNFTFASAGRFTYHCQIHPNMVGTIVVQ